MEARSDDSRSWLASDDPYGSFADFCASRAAMKTCFVVLEQAEKPVQTSPESFKRILDRKIRFLCVRLAELALTVQLDQSQIHRVTLSPRRAQASSAFDSS